LNLRQVGIVADVSAVRLAVDNHHVAIYRTEAIDPLTPDDGELEPGVADAQTPVAYVFTRTATRPRFEYIITPIVLEGTGPPSPIAEMSLCGYGETTKPQINGFSCTLRTRNGEVHHETFAWHPHRAPTDELIREPAVASRIHFPPGLHPVSVAVGQAMCVRTEEWQRENEPEAVWFGEDGESRNRLVERVGGMFKGKGKAKLW
jgi:hypothetical protein